MERFAHLSTHPHMTRKTAGIDRHSRMDANTLTRMILRCHPQDTAIFHCRLFNRMAHTQCSASSNGTPCKVLVNSSHIHYTGDRGIIIKRHFTVRGYKHYLCYRMIQVLGDGKCLHSPYPASPACMNRISNLVLTL